MDLDLFMQYKMSKSSAIRNRIVLENMKLVYRVVRSFTKRKTLDPDLTQAGVLGLIKAVERFDVYRLVNRSPNLFFVFATWQIFQEIQRACENNRSVKRGVVVTELLFADVTSIVKGHDDGSSVSDADARIDLRTALEGVTDEDLQTLVALAEDANPGELAKALGMSARRDKEVAAVIAEGVRTRVRKTLR